MNRRVSFKETVELFLTNTIYDIVNEIETPRINFVFNKEAYDLFKEIKENPFKLNNGWTPDIKDKDINFLKNSIDYEYPTIYIKDHIKFFTYLTEITNNSIKQHNNYNTDKLSRQHLIYTLKRIWLRMGPNDINNIEEFLYKQLLFNMNDLFNDYKFKKKTYHKINTYHNYDVIAENKLNNTWDESTKCMSFKILNNTSFHSLPNIYYDTLNKECYIYAIQNNRNPNKSKEIDKLIYKEYKGKGQPNKIYALKLFIKMLKEKNIKTIKVPTLQILNFRYHEILSIKEKERFNQMWPKDTIKNLSNFEKIYYNQDLLWFNHIVDKEDTISKLKTEDLINIVYRIVKEDNELFITNDIDLSDTLDIKILTKER